MQKRKKLKVTIFAQYFPPDLGGSATRAYNIAKGLSLNGCDVTVVAAFPHYPSGNIPGKYRWKPVEVEEMDGFKVVRSFILPLKSEGFFKRLLLIGSFALSAIFAMPLYYDSDIVWASSWVPSVFYGKLWRKKVALNVDDLTLMDIVDLKLINEQSIIMKIGKIIYSFFFRQGDVITPISPGYISVISSCYGIPLGKFQVIPAGVDLTTFSSNSLQNDKFIITYSGALSIAYDFDLVLSAADRLKNYSDIEFVIQGAGDDAGKLKKRIEEENLTNVKILNVIISRREVSVLLNEAKVLLLPLRSFGKPYLGLSTKLYEYQAIGKPIICCAEGVPSEYIQNTNSGLVVNPGDLDKLCDSIIYLKDNPINAKQLGTNGKIYVENNLSIEKIGLKLKQILNKEIEVMKK